MQIFKFCPHCNKKLFLIYDMDLASLFGKDEYEHIKDEKKKVEDSYGNKRWPTDYVGEEKKIRQEGGYDTVYPKGYPDRHMEADWTAFDDFMKGLNVSHGPRLHASFGEQDIIKIRKLSLDGGKTPHKDLQKLITDWMEPKDKERFWKKEAEQAEAKQEKIRKEKAEALFNDNKDWKDPKDGIDPNIDDRIKREWCHEGFGFNDAKAWMKEAGLNIGEAKLASWLKAPPRNLTPEQVIQAANLTTLREQWKTETKRDTDDGKPPEKPNNQSSTDTIRGWRHRQGITEDEWRKVMSVPELAAIVGDRNFLFTRDEIKNRIAEAKVKNNPEDIEFELRHQSPIVPPETQTAEDGKEYLIIHTQPFRYKQNPIINDIYCEGDNAFLKAKEQYIRDENNNNRTVGFILTGRVIKNQKEGQGPTAWKNNTALMVESGWDVRAKGAAGLRTDWENMLKEISKFFETVKFVDNNIGGVIESGAKTEEEIKKFVNDTIKKTWDKPMGGILLKGANPLQLINDFRYNVGLGARNTLNKASGVVRDYRDYEPLPSSPDGNCFFNAFSILLYGDESLSTRLRLAMCIGVMDGTLSGFNAFQGGSMPTIDYDEINRKLPGMSAGGSYKGWAETQHIAYVSQLLKRPIQMLYHVDPDTQGLDPTKHAYQELKASGGFAFIKFISQARDKSQLEYNPDNNSYFTIFHVNGNHFVPLVHPKKIVKYTDKDLDIHPYILVNFFIKTITYQAATSTLFSEPELQVKIIQKKLGDENNKDDIIPDDWKNEELGMIIIHGTEATLQAEQAKLKTGEGFSWSISGAMEITRDNFGTGRMTFTPGAILEMDGTKPKPTTSTNNNPTFVFYLTNYEVRDGAGEEGCIAISIETDYIERHHLTNASGIDESKITNGIWVWAEEENGVKKTPAGWPTKDEVRINAWYEVQGKLKLTKARENRYWLVVEDVKGWTETSEPPNKRDWGSYGSIDREFRDFTGEITQRWKDIGFTRDRTLTWLKAGVGWNEYDFADWLIKVKNITNPPFTNLSVLRNSFEKREHDINFSPYCPRPWNNYLKSANGLKIYTGNTASSLIGDAQINDYVFIRTRGLNYKGIGKAEPTGFLFLKSDCQGIREIEMTDQGEVTRDLTTGWNGSVDYFDIEHTRGDSWHTLTNDNLEMNIYENSEVKWINWASTTSSIIESIEKNALLLITGRFKIVRRTMVASFD